MWRDETTLSALNPPLNLDISVTVQQGCENQLNIMLEGLNKE